MALDRSKEVERLYHTARSRAPEEQAAFLETASAGDGELRQEVESLLAQDEAVESFLEVSAAEVAVRMIREDIKENLVGRQLVSYQVRSHIGAGEMGEVYLARDLTLNRDVAIKLLLRGFEQTPDRLARFRREAETLASLNHPNIAAIHRFEQSNDLYFLVLEFVPGETLADQIAKGPMPLQESLRICGQVSEALEEAHRNGITHRDIKPANIKVTPEGKVKVLDFGLAKVFSEGSPAFFTGAPNPADSQPGLILGTPAYMSPEQARGKPVDKQTDIWAFGCLLYEMLTASPAFRGETLTDTMAAVLEHEPDWSILPSGIPEEIHLLVRRCLEKEKHRRLHDIADARITIEDALAVPAGTASSRRITVRSRHNRRLRSSATVITVIAAVAFIVTLVREFFPKFISAPSPVSRFTYVLPPGERLTMLQASALSVSPDGRQFAYVASVEGARSQIYIRSLDSLEAKPLAGTEGADTPFFSPDGQWLGFWAGRMQKISPGGGAPVSLARWENTNGGAIWTPGDTIIYPLSNRSALYKLPGNGGNPQPITTLENDTASHRWPELLPGGKAVIYTDWKGTADSSQIVVQRLNTQERRVLVQGGTFPRYVPTGYLVFAKAGNLMAVPFDPDRLEMKGKPVQVLEGVMQTIQGAAQYAFSSNGSLLYVPGGVWIDPAYLVSVDRSGNEKLLKAPPRPYLQLDVSPDGTQAALLIQQGKMDLWTYNFDRNQLSRLTSDGMQTSPVWSPDGRKIAYGKTLGGRRNLFWRSADGSGVEEQLTTSGFFYQPGSISSANVAAYIEMHPETGRDIYVTALNGDRKSRPWLQEPYDESMPVFSPDGRFIAYVSNETGRFEIFVQPYPGPGGKWQISTDGGEQPLWNPNGKELFYRNGDKTMSVEIATEPRFHAGNPRLLFEGRYKKQPGPGTNFGVTPDGQHFIMVKPGDQEASATEINLVMNWFDDLKQRVANGQK